MVFTIYIRKLVSFVLTCLLIGPVVYIQAQDTTDINPKNAGETNYLLKLDKGWSHEGRPLSIPFQLESLDEATIINEFSLPDSVSWPIALYVERASWDVEVEINGRYLGVNREPFAPFSISLDSLWLSKGQNQIKIKLSRGENCYLCPRHLLGIYQPVYLVEEARLAYLNRPIMKTVQKADTVAIVAPFYRDHGYAFDLFEATRTLLPLIQGTHRYIYFPFEPDQKLKELCHKLDFIRVKEISDETVIGLVNYCPYEASNFPWSYSFWLDSRGRRTKVYQDFRSTDSYVKEVDLSENRNLIILLSFFPLIAFVVLKLLGAGFFEAQGALLFNPKLYIDSSLNSSDTQQGWLLILQFFRLTGTAISAALFIYFIRLTHQWDLLNILRETSLLKNYFYPASSLIEILIRAFMVVVAWFLLKHSIILLIGGAFRVKGMLGSVMNLDILGSYPLIILLPIPASLLLFWGDITPHLALGFMLFCGGIYMARKLYIIFLGLNRLFGFPSTMKFLYICTFNIFPYMFWL